MSTTIHGIIEHHLMYPPDQNLPDEMNATIKSRNPFLRGPWSWNEYVKKRNMGWALKRVDSTEIWLGSKAALLVTGIAWLRACRDKRLRRNLLLAMFEVAKFFKSPGIILMPDDEDPRFSIHQTVTRNGASFEEVMEKVTQIRAPCQIMREALQQDKQGSID